MNNQTSQSQNAIKKDDLEQALDLVYPLCSSLSHLRAKLDENKEVTHLDCFKLDLLCGLVGDCNDEIKTMKQIIHAQNKKPTSITDTFFVR